MKRATIWIFGQVQGVFFRHTARLYAEKLGITGLARNEADDSLTLVVEGEEEALKKFLDWCRQGPPLASVEKCEIQWAEATGEFKRFEII